MELRHGRERFRPPCPPGLRPVDVSTGPQASSWRDRIASKCTRGSGAAFTLSQTCRSEALGPAQGGPQSP